MKKKVPALAALLLAVVVGVSLGAERFSFKEIVNSLWGTQSSDLAGLIVWGIRLPRVILAGLCGALLAGAGVIFQGFFRNPLADSGIMGISSGATLGAVTSALIPWGMVSASFAASNFVSFCGFAMALVTALVILIIVQFHGGYGGGGFQGSSVLVLLTGTALSSFFSSITSIILLVKYKELHKMFVWTLGSFSGKNWNDFYFLLPVTVVCIVLLALCPKYLDILGSGEVTAISLGLDYKKARILVLCAGSLAATTAVCMGGTIGFVGLIVPHLVRKFAGPGHGQLLTLSLLWGAVFVILCDLVARIAFPPSEIPVGVITALAGAPFFVSLLFAKEGLYGK